MISFNIEIANFKISQIRHKKSWLKALAEEENFKIAELNYVFLSDEALLKINQEYLNHDTYTDIITFDNSDEENQIESDIFISVDRIKENAKKFQVPFDTELCRVMAHGLLHLCGYKDKKPDEKTLMRSKEDYYLGKM